MVLNSFAHLTKTFVVEMMYTYNLLCYVCMYVCMYVKCSTSLLPTDTMQREADSDSKNCVCVCPLPSMKQALLPRSCQFLNPHILYVWCNAVRV